MKTAKRILLGLVGLIVIVAIGLAVYLQVRKYKAKSELIHVKSTAVVKVAIDDIIIDVLKSELRNTDFFKEKSPTDSSKKKQDLDIGMLVPSSMYFFCIEENYTDLYTYQRLDDAQKFIAVLVDQLGLDSTAVLRESDYWAISAKGDKLNIIGDDKNVLFAVSSSSYGKMDALKTMWEDRNRNMQKVESVALLQTNTNANIEFINLLNKDNFALSFDNGMIKTTANIYSHPVQANVSNMVRKMSDDDILSAYVNLDVRPLLHKYSFFLDRNPNLKDVLSNSFAGYADIQWKKGEVIQQDTVITYDYDENFEQIEKKELRDEQVPFLVATFKGTTALQDFFPDKMFYKVAKSEQNGYVVLTTSSEKLQPIELVQSPNFMELNYRFDDAISSYVSRIPKVDKIKAIQIVGKTIDKELSQFEIVIQMLDPDSHPISQLF